MVHILRILELLEQISLRCRIYNKSTNIISTTNKWEEDIILYKEVLLFGPTDAKSELLNILHADLRFKEISIEVLSADNMTENQKLAFVKTYFSKQ